MTGDGDGIKVSIEAFDLQQAKELAGALEESGAEDVRVTGGGEGILFIPAVVGAVIAVTALADLIERWRRNHMCREIIEVRKDGSTANRKDCDFHDGKIISISPEGMQVEVHDVPDGVDVTKVIESALKSGGEAVKAAAEAVGAKATDPKPAGG
jgi:hypothetical protein